MSTHYILWFGFLILLISGCSSDNESIFEPPPSISEVQALGWESISEVDNHSSIFISGAQIDVDPELITSIRLTIENKENAVSDEVSVLYSGSRVANGDNVLVPIFGLYEDYANHVEALVTFTDASTTVLSLKVETPAYDDPQRINLDLEIRQGSDLDSKPSFSFFLLKPNTSNIDPGNQDSYGGVILDIDGNIRWARNVPSMGDPLRRISRATTFRGDHMVAMTYGAEEPSLVKLHLNGNVDVIPISGTSYVLDTEFIPHHDIRSGKQGLFFEMNVSEESLGVIRGQILLEIDDEGKVLKEFDFGKILTRYMLENGDDPGNFDRSPVNWFHANSTIYDPRDDTVISSSRENFIIKVGYDDKEIKWIFGDPNKHWFINFPSLQNLALTTHPDYPIGQHSLSIDGDVLMFYNNGMGSFQNPENTPPGLTTNASIMSKYMIDEADRQATRVWNYDPGLFSGVCSSIFRDVDSGDYLINHSAVGFSLGGGRDQVIDNVFVGLNDQKELLFEYVVPSMPCVVSWNTEIVDLSDLVFD